jgi:hypothetical protein
MEERASRVKRRFPMAAAFPGAAASPYIQCPELEIFTSLWSVVSRPKEIE